MNPNLSRFTSLGHHLVGLKHQAAFSYHPMVSLLADEVLNPMFIHSDIVSYIVEVHKNSMVGLYIFLNKIHTDSNYHHTPNLVI